jgi:hypothetical protein
MSWHRVIITNPAMAQTAIDRLLLQWRAVSLTAGRPADAEVWRDPSSTDAVYYFSPTASLLAKDILYVFGAAVCPKPPNLNALEKVVR